MYMYIHIFFHIISTSKLLVIILLNIMIYLKYIILIKKKIKLNFFLIIFTQSLLFTIYVYSYSIDSKLFNLFVF